jgi:hypothetical protein
VEDPAYPRNEDLSGPLPNVLAFYRGAEGGVGRKALLGQRPRRPGPPPSHAHGMVRLRYAAPAHRAPPSNPELLFSDEFAGTVAAVIPYNHGIRRRPDPEGKVRAPQAEQIVP